METLVFRGNSEISMDLKGRVAFSVRYRDELMARCGGRIVVTIDIFNRCLMVYPEPEWEAFEREFASNASCNEANEGARVVQRLKIGHARELALDNTGRVLIPPELRDYAELVKDVVLVGTGRLLELWDLNAWKTKRELWISEATTSEKLKNEIQQLL